MVKITKKALVEAFPSVVQVNYGGHYWICKIRSITFDHLLIYHRKVRELSPDDFGQLDGTSAKQLMMDYVVSIAVLYTTCDSVRDKLKTDLADVSVSDMSSTITKLTKLSQLFASYLDVLSFPSDAVIEQYKQNVEWRELLKELGVRVPPEMELTAKEDEKAIGVPGKRESEELDTPPPKFVQEGEGAPTTASSATASPPAPSAPLRSTPDKGRQSYHVATSTAPPQFKSLIMPKKAHQPQEYKRNRTEVSSENMDVHNEVIRLRDTDDEIREKTEEDPEDIKRIIEESGAKSSTGKHVLNDEEIDEPDADNIPNLST